MPTNTIVTTPTVAAPRWNAGGVAITISVSATSAVYTGMPHTRWSVGIASTKNDAVIRAAATTTSTATTTR